MLPSSFKITPVNPNKVGFLRVRFVVGEGGNENAVDENVSFIDHASRILIDHASGIRLPDCYRLAINQKNGNGIAIC